MAPGKPYLQAHASPHARSAASTEHGARVARATEARPQRRRGACVRACEAGRGGLRRSRVLECGGGRAHSSAKLKSFSSMHVTT
eukprot:3124656-Pleurochrysis_carterae.AAC.2